MTAAEIAEMRNAVRPYQGGAYEINAENAKRVLREVAGEIRHERWRWLATLDARDAEIAQLKGLLREVSATSARIPANPVMATFSLNTLAKIDVATKEASHD